MGTRQLGNNWVPMVCLAALFLGGAAVDLASTSSAGAVSLFYVIGGLLLSVVCGIWLVRHPPALHGSAKAYIYTLCGLEFAVLFGGAIEPLRGCGAWLLLGLGVAAYGWLERARIIITVGAATSVTALLAVLITAPVVGGAMQALSAAFFFVAAYRLHHMKHGPRVRKEAVDLSNLNLL